jgi:acetyl esterase
MEYSQMADPAIAEGYRGLLAMRRMLGPGRFPPEKLDEARALTSRWLAQWALSTAPTVISHDEHDGGQTRWRVFQPPEVTNNAHVFFIHGGGLVFYSLHDYAGVLSHLAEWSGHVVTAFAYPPAPEHAVDDILEALAQSISIRLGELPGDAAIALAGDSIGAYLALYLAVRRRGLSFRRLLLINPVLDILGQRPSYAAYGTGYTLTAPAMGWFQSLWRGARLLRDFDPFGLSPQDRAALPKVHLFSAEFDVLRDEAFDWASAMRQFGVQIVHRHFHNLCHDFCLHAGAVPQARDAVRSIAADLVEISSEPILASGAAAV